MNPNVFGYVATTLNVVMLTPQVITTWKTRDTRSLSLTAQCIFLIACILWTTYGILTHALPVILANSIVGVHLVVLILLKIKYPGDRK